MVVMNFSTLLSVYIKENPLYLRECMDSLINQQLRPTEIILVEDGPLTDQLYTVISEYQLKLPNLKVISFSQNQGLGKALNEGLKHCSYDIVARMDTDDVAKPNRFKRQIEILKKHPNIDVVGAWIDEFEGTTDNVRSQRKLPEMPEEIAKYARKRCPVNHPVVMFRKKAVLDAGGYQHFPLMEDCYLWVRMLMNGSRFYNIQESLLYFRFSPNMFKRRGGWKYAMDEFRFQRLLLERGFISISTFMSNVIIRFSTRIMPNTLRKWIYKKLLRK